MGKRRATAAGSVWKWAPIGRERERAALLEGLRPGRLVLVTGPRGVGKTALVETIAHDSSPRAPVLYVRDARTCASACAGIAAALAAARSSTERARLESRLKRGDGRARSALIEARRRGTERGIVFDHVDFPGPRIDGLVDLWRERTAVVLVARSEETLGKLQRHLYDYDTIRIEPLTGPAATRLIELACGSMRLSLSASEAQCLVRLTAGLPGLLCRTLALAARRRGGGMPIDPLVRQARVEELAAERDAIIRGRRRAERRRR